MTARRGSSRRRRTVGASLLLLASSGGCVVPRKAGFDDVERLTRASGVARIHWNQGRPEDDEVRRHVDALLARPLTATTATEIALLHSPRLQATFERLGVAQADVVQAGLLRNPSFTVGVGVPLTAGAQTSYELTIVAELLDVFLLPLRKRYAAATFERIKLEVADAVLDAAAEARAAYYEALAADEGAALWRRIADAADAAATLAERQLAAGALPDLDAASHQARAAEVRLEVARAESTRLAARERLSRALGVWGAQAAWTFAGGLDAIPPSDPPLEHVESRAIASRLDLRAARLEAATIHSALSLTQATRVVSAAGVGGRLDRDPEGNMTLGPSFSIELPLFDQKQAAVARLRAELRQAERRAAALAVDIRSEARLAHARLAAARSTVELYRGTLLPLRERVVALSQQRYDAMLLGVYQLLEAKRAEVAAYRDYLDAVRDYWLARVALERAIAGPLDAPLDGAAPPQSTPTK